MPDKPQRNDVESEKNSRVHDEQRSLHLSLKPQITKLCEFLLLPVCRMFFSLLSFTYINYPRQDCILITRLFVLMKTELYCMLEFDVMVTYFVTQDNVKKMTDRFLEYVMNKHHFKKELFSIQSIPITLVRISLAFFYLLHPFPQPPLLSHILLS